MSFEINNTLRFTLESTTTSCFRGQRGRFDSGENVTCSNVKKSISLGLSL